VNKIADGSDVPENIGVGRNMLQNHSKLLSHLLCPLLVKSVDRLLLMGMALQPVTKNLMFVDPCIIIRSINNQLDAVFSFFLYFCYTLYMFRVPFAPIIRSILKTVHAAWWQSCCKV
jgi:hypothetical protein